MLHNATSASCALPRGAALEAAQPLAALLPAVLVAGAMRRCAAAGHARSDVVFAYDVRRQLFATWFGYSVLLHAARALPAAAPCAALLVLLVVDASLGTVAEAGLLRVLRNAGYRLGYYSDEPDKRLWAFQSAAHACLSVCLRSVSVCCTMLLLHEAKPASAAPQPWWLLGVLAPAGYFAARVALLDGENTYRAPYNVLVPRHTPPPRPRP